jgi:hypothetical protein
VTERSDGFSEAVVQRLAMPADDVAVLDCARRRSTICGAFAAVSPHDMGVGVHYQRTAVMPLSGKSMER